MRAARGRAVAADPAPDAPPRGAATPTSPTYAGQLTYRLELERAVCAWLETQPRSRSARSRRPPRSRSAPRCWRSTGTEVEEIDLLTLSTYVNLMGLPAAAVPIRRSARRPADRRPGDRPPRPRDGGAGGRARAGAEALRRLDRTRSAVRAATWPEPTCYKQVLEPDDQAVELADLAHRQQHARHERLARDASRGGSSASGRGRRRSPPGGRPGPAAARCGSGRPRGRRPPRSARPCASPCPRARRASRRGAARRSRSRACAARSASRPPSSAPRRSRSSAR